MARVKLQFPDEFVFTTNIDVLIGDINYGGHLGNDSVLSVVHEARLRFLKHFGQTELNFYGNGTIMSDAAIEFRGEAFHGDRLEIEIAAGEFSHIGFDIFYLIKNEAGKEIARVKTGIVCFDYDKRKPVPLPDGAKEILNK